MTNDEAFKFSIELPSFSCLSIKPSTCREIAEALDIPVKNIFRAFEFYQKYRYVSSKQDWTLPWAPKRYKLTTKGWEKLKKMEKQKTDHPEQWGKPKTTEMIIEVDT